MTIEYFFKDVSYNLHPFLSIKKYFYKEKKDKKIPIITLCGTYKITNWVFKLWENYCYSKGKRKSSGPRKLTSNNTWEIRISGIGAMKFYNLIKNLNIPKMETKWDIFKNKIAEKGNYYLKDFGRNKQRDISGRFCKTS